MGAELDRVKERARSRSLINELYQNAQRVYVVHYSCESFYENATGSTLRVTSIAIRNLKSAQTKSWSLHNQAELLGIASDISANLDRLERAMLNGYFEFLKLHADCQFIHWNMRDENYGFYALEHRYRVLGGLPFELRDERKIDCSGARNLTYLCVINVMT